MTVCYVLITYKKDKIFLFAFKVMTLESEDELSQICFFFKLIAAERTEERKLEEQLLESAREGDVSKLTQLVSSHTRHIPHFSHFSHSLLSFPFVLKAPPQ